MLRCLTAKYFINNDTQCLVRLWSYWNARILLVGVQNGAATLEKFLTIRLNILLPHDPKAPLLAICQRGIKTYVHTKACTQMYSSSVHNCCKPEATQISVMGEWISKLVLYTETLLSPSLDSSPRYYAERKKPASGGYMNNTSISVTVKKTKPWCQSRQGSGMGRECGYRGQH